MTLMGEPNAIHDSTLQFDIYGAHCLQLIPAKMVIELKSKLLRFDLKKYFLSCLVVRSTCRRYNASKANFTTKCKKSMAKTCPKKSTSTKGCRKVVIAYDGIDLNFSDDFERLPKNFIFLSNQYF